MPRRLDFVRRVAALAAGSLVFATCSAGTAEPSAQGFQLPRRLPASTGATFYVAPNGSDSNPGTRTRPWRTVQHAAETLRPGQRALVRAGTYQENVHVDRSGTVTRPITIGAYPGERPVIENAQYPLEINGAYFRIRGFVIQGARGLSSTNVYFESNAHHIELLRNEIRFSQDQGVYSEEETHDLFVLSNRIHDNGLGHEPGQHQSHGLYLQGRNHLVANNAIYDHPFGFGIQVYDQNEGSIIVNNTVVKSGHSGIVVGGSGGVSDITIRNNIIAFNSSFGVQMDSTCPTGEVAVDTNVIYGNPSGRVEPGCDAVIVEENIAKSPRFVALASRRLWLRRTSPARDLARADFAPRTDITGRRRPSGRGYEIGAYELVR